MSEFITDLSGVLSNSSIDAITAKNSTNKKAGADLEMTDFLKLMVATFQNQSIDDVASTSDMMNQMVLMSVINAVTNLNKLLTESTGLNYAASLVGKEVTIAQQVGRDVYTFTGTVTGTGTLNGEQMIFLGDDSYMLSDVIAVGHLPGDADVAASLALNTSQNSTAAARQSAAYPTVAPDRSDSGLSEDELDAVERQYFETLYGLDGVTDGYGAEDALEEQGADIGPDVFETADAEEEETVYYPVEASEEAAGNGEDGAYRDDSEDTYETTV